MTFQEELAQPENEYIAVIGNYLMERAKTDASVANNLKKENKSLKRCFQFIIDEAKKQQKNNCAMVKDDVVFGWAVHYYDEDDLSIDNAVKHEKESKKEDKKKPKEEPKKKLSEKAEKKVIEETEITTKKKEMKKNKTVVEDQLSLF